MMRLHDYMCLRSRRPPRSTRTDTLVPCTTLVRSRPDCRSVSRGGARIARGPLEKRRRQGHRRDDQMWREDVRADRRTADQGARRRAARRAQPRQDEARPHGRGAADLLRSEEHTSELQSLMRISYAVFCLKQKKKTV